MKTTKNLICVNSKIEFIQDGCQIARSGDAGLQTTGWTLGFIAEMMTPQNVSRVNIAQLLNDSFKTYHESGHQ